jgi:hypothetical protein
VQWQLHVFEGNGTHNKIAQKVNLHKCSEKDWQNFDEPSKKSKISFDNLKMQNEMYCMNHEDNKGNEINMNMFGDG